MEYRKKQQRATGVSPLFARRLPFRLQSSRSTKKKKDWGALLTMQCRAHGLPIPQAEFHFKLPGRRNPHRFDFAWPDQRVAIEIDGGLFVGGRHSRGAGIEHDQIKMAYAAIAGWTVLRVSPRLLTSGQVALWLRELLAATRPK